MPEASTLLAKVFEGWEGYNTSLVHAIQPLTTQQLAWRPAESMRSVGELASHIALGRIDWFSRIPAPGSLELKEKRDALGPGAVLAGDKEAILRWMEDSWQMIERTLSEWTVEDLWRTYRQEYWGKTYLVSYQWVVWRIITHDVHHGGELACMLGMQEIRLPELGDLGGHLVWPPLAE